MDKEMLDTLLAAMADMKDSMNNGFAEVHAGLDKLEARMERLECKVDDLVDKLEAIALDVDIIKATVKKQDYEINRLKKVM